jgi:enamine deaminase RidA (YjgF/YER057c/UK114 family)
VTRASTRERVVAGTINTGAVYCSTVAGGSGFVFFGGAAIGDDGRLAPSARPAEPYEFSEAAKVRAQARFLLEQFRTLLPAAGSSLDDIAAMEHYLKLKTHADGYFKTALGKGFLEAERPIGATASVGTLVPDDAVINLTGIALVRDPKRGFVKSYPEEVQKNPHRLYPEMLMVGPYVFTTYLAFHPKLGLDPAAKTEDWNWRGSEIRTEAEHAVQTIKARLATVGCSLDDVANYTLFLTEPGDLYELDLVFAETLGRQAPSRMIIPATGYQTPRREGAFGHLEGSPRMEAQFRCVRPGFGAQKVVVPGPGDGYGCQSAAVRVGPLVWISAQVADAGCRGDGTGREADNIFEKIGTVCRNAGTTLDQLLRVRVLLARPADAPDVYSALRRAVPSAPPVVNMLAARPPFYVSGNSVAVDAVAYAAEGV